MALIVRKQALAPHRRKLKWLAEHLKANPMNKLVVIDGVTPPDTAYTRQAVELVKAVHTPVLINHVHRSWWFGEFLGRKRGLKYDREVVYIAALLHDLGLTEKFAADSQFEVDGADAASSYLKGNGYSEEKAELVWKGIALHSNLAIADRMQPEIALISFGAHVDVFGLNLEAITPSFVDDVLALHPRMGMKAAFTAAVAEVVRKKPHLATGTALADVGRRHIHGFDCPNVCDLIEAAPFES